MHYFKYYFSAVQQWFSNLLASEPLKVYFTLPSTQAIMMIGQQCSTPAACLILDVHGFIYLVSFLHYPKFGGTFW